MDLNFYGRPGMILKDARYKYQLTKPRKSEVFGDTELPRTAHAARMRIEWLCHNQWSVTMTNMDAWCKKNNPRMEITDLTTMDVHVFSWLSGYQGTQLELPFGQDAVDRPA